ncbi:MAG: hypothetical protein AABX17_04045 [Nanoarchaeota archaeon]
MNSKILFLIVISLFCLHFASAELDIRITGSIVDTSSIFYTETGSSSSSGYDGNDVIAPGHFPSGNSSRFYSTVSGNQLAIDSWSLTSVPRSIVLTFETSPAQSGTLDLSWSFSDAVYDATLSYCGADSSCASPTNTVNMETLSDLSVIITGSPRYFKLSIYDGVYCGDGSCNNGETTSTCSQDCHITGCSDTCNTLGYSCGNQLICGSSVNCGSCNAGYSCISGSCSLTLCVPKTCSQLGVGCGTATDGCGNNLNCGGCGVGYNCISGACQSTTQTCTPVCSAGYSCISGSCVEGIILPNNQIPANLPAGSGASETCKQSFICGSWNECNINYNVATLTIGSSLSGERKRICSDKNKCFVNFEQKESCSLKEEVEVRITNWCGQEFTEIVGQKTGKVLARIKVLPDGRAANLNFNVEGEGTCAYCYDGVKNYDETDIDCGGSSCISCSSSKLKRTGVFIIGTIYGYLLPLLIFIIFLFMLIYTLRFVFNYMKQVAENWILRRYCDWKKDGYDVFVLDEHIKSIKHSHRRL